MKKLYATAAGVAAMFSHFSVKADPPPEPMLPDLFCFRITDIAQVKSDLTGKTFDFEFEVLNWGKQPAYGVSIALDVQSGLAFSGGGTDPLGRKLVLPPSEQPPPGNMSMSALYPTPTYVAPGNSWAVSVDTATAIQWQGTPGPNPAIANFPVTPLFQPSWLSTDQFPGEDPLERIDDGFNVMDGFTFRVEDFDPGDQLSFNWFLLDDMGNPFPILGPNKDNFGFGALNLARVEGVGAVDFLFVENTGYLQSLKEFAPFDSTLPAGVLVNQVPDPATFATEFVGGKIADFQNPNDAARLGVRVQLPIPPEIRLTPVPEVRTYAAGLVLLSLCASSARRVRRGAAPSETA
jgi:hypothetical protein